MMRERVLTDNHAEIIVVIWDGERFAITQHVKLPDVYKCNAIILNPEEMKKLVEFAKNPNIGES